MDTEQSNVQKEDQIEETDPDLSATQDEAEESKRKLKTTYVSALDMTLESLWKLGAFLSDLLLDYVQEVPQSDSEDEHLPQDPQDLFYEYLLNDLDLPQSLVGNVALDLFIKIVEHIPCWNSHFEVYQIVKKICNRCKMDLEYPFEHSYGLIIVADSLRVLKAAFKDFTFETILKFIKIKAMMLCDKEGCGKRNYVDSVILKLPSVFTIALEWENNETEEDIFDTTSVLVTEIDITAIYRYEGDSTFTKYRLVSMVCLCGDRYNCVAYERNRWVRYLSSETEVIGDWDGVLSMFRKLNMRPEILFFENAMQRDQMFTCVSALDKDSSKAQEVDIVKETDPDLSVKHDQAPLPLKPEESVEKTNASCVSALDIDLSKVREVEKVKETDPDLLVKHDQAPESMKPEESVEKPNTTCVSSLDMDSSEVEKVKETDPDLSVTHDHVLEPMKPDATCVSALDMDSSKVQEVEKVKETDPDAYLLVRDLSMTHDQAPEPMKQDGTCVSALDTILKSLWQISVFTSQFANYTEIDTVVPPQDQFRDFILNNITLTQPMEEQSISDLLVTIMELLPRWRSVNGEEPLNSHIQVYEVAKKSCNRCKMDMEYPVERAYGLIITANSLRESKAAFKNFTFEDLIKFIRMKLKMPCDKEGCGKRSYVQRMINKLPSAFTIALKWENNETEEEIFDTTSVLETEIDISVIYKYEGDNSVFTNYRLVSMVCLCGDLYNCVAYENKRWVRHFCTEIEDIGEWDGVLSMFRKLNIRPEILFFENAMPRDQMFSAKGSEGSKDE